ncbi:Cytochrome P450 CYP4, partial [Frankliniella occidentalis]
MSYTATSILGNFSVTKFLTNLTLAAILWLLILQAFQFLRKCIHFRRIEQTIPGPFSVPFFGSVFWLSLNADNCLEKILDSVKPYWPGLVRYSAFNKLHVMVNDADHIAKVLRDRHFSDKPWMFYGPLKPIIRDGIFTSNGEPWQAHRLVITPTFHAEVMGRYVEILDMEAKEFVDKLSGMLHKDVDCSDTMIRTASFMAIRTMMSSTLNERECSILEEIISLVPRALKSVNRRSLNPFLWPDWIFKWTQMYRDTEAAKTLFDMLINSIIQRKSSEIHATASRERQLASKLGFRDRKSLLDLLLESKFSGELRMTDEDILNETSTMFITAFDTPVIVVTFVLKVLSIRPDIQELVYAEICDVLQEKDHKLSSDDLS